MSRFGSVADDAMEREEGKAAGRKGEQRLIILWCFFVGELKSYIRAWYEDDLCLCCTNLCSPG